MRTSTEIGSIAHFVGEEKAVEFVAKAGFDCWDFSLLNMGRYDWINKKMILSSHPLQSGDYIAFSKNLKKIGEDNGISCNQSHAPFPTYCKEIKDLLKRAIECSAEAGAKICIIHPENNKNALENAENFLSLLPFAKSHGVKIACENMWNWDDLKNQATSASCSDEQDFVKHLNAVNDDDFVACLDIGHAEMQGLNTSAVKMIYALKDKLQALHIHDTDTIHDNHTLPFTMKIDFIPIIKALKDINYKGDFTLEADTYISNFYKDDVFTGVKKMADTARILADKFENLR